MIAKLNATLSQYLSLVVNYGNNTIYLKTFIYLFKIKTAYLCLMCILACLLEESVHDN